MRLDFFCSSRPAAQIGLELQSPYHFNFIWYKRSQFLLNIGLSRNLLEARMPLVLGSGHLDVYMIRAPEIFDFSESSRSTYRPPTITSIILLLPRLYFYQTSFCPLSIEDLLRT